MNKVRNFLILIRYSNLLLIFLTQLLIEYYLLKPYFQIEDLTNSYLITISTILIAASGYIINDIMDLNIDKANNKYITINQSFSSKTAIIWYYLLNSIAIIHALILCLRINKLYLLFIFIICIFLLAEYSRKYKKSLLIGNVIISLLVCLSFINVFIFKDYIDMSKFNIILIYSTFALLITFVREIIKDIEDIQGDQQNQCRSIPIIYGIRKSKIICISLLSVVIILIVHLYIQNHIINLQELNIYTSIYFIMLTIIILYSIISIYKSNNKKDFNMISKSLKIIMFLGLISIPIFKYY